MEKLVMLALAAGMLVLNACGPSTAPTMPGAGGLPPTARTAEPSAPVPASSAQPALGIRDALSNMEYLIDLTASKKALLKDGVFEEAVAPGSASKVRIVLGPARGYGDLNGDGAEDAAVILTGSAGGTGTFTYVSLVLNEKGVPKCVGSALLGDRVSVTGVEIQSGKLVVNMLDRKPGEPMSSPPTVALTRTFQRAANGLVEVK